MKSIKIIVLVIASLLICDAYAQNLSYNYISPVPNSKYINPEQTIVLKTGIEFDFNSISKSMIDIAGSKSGQVIFEMKLSDNGKILFIVPQDGFILGETVEVKVNSGIRTKQGKEIEGVSFSFNIKSEDNLGMLIKYYRGQNTSHQDVIKPESDNRNSTFNLNLPADYPPVEMISFQETDKQYLFYTLTPRAGAPQYNNYLSINDEYGVPVFFRKTPTNTLYFHNMEDGKLAYGRNKYNQPEIERYFFMDSSYVVIDSIKTGNGYNLDAHDILPLPNGNYLLMSYDPQPVDMSTIVLGGDPNATVIGLVIQEVDMNENVHFQWRSWDHFQITDATDDINLLANQIDYVHGNAFELDTDGNILLSSRHLDEITKIDFETGDVIYRFGKGSKNNQFTINNDVYGFSHQHDVRLMPNGNFTIYDNGNLHSPQFSRALEYSIDEENMIGELVWYYRNNPDVYGMATGSYRRDESGDHLIGWGSTWPLAATFVFADDTKAYEVNLPNGVYSYRVIKSDWKTNLFVSLDNLNLGNYHGDGEPKEIILPIRNNSENQIRISSLHLHSSHFNVQNDMPLVLFSGDTVNIVVDFLPPDTGIYNDRLTLNYDMFSLEGTERIAIQVDLVGIWDNTFPHVHFIPHFNAIDIDPETNISIEFSEPVRKVNGGLITSNDIPQLFNIKLHNQWGDMVPFSGSISDDYMNITLYPETKLLENENYYVELIPSKVEDFDGNHLDYVEATYFETGIITGDKPIYTTEEIKVFPSPFRDILNIKIPEESNYSVRIFSSTGKIVFSDESVNRSTRIQTKDFPSGVYFVNISNEFGVVTSRKVVKY